MKAIKQLMRFKKVAANLAAPADPDLFIEMIEVFRVSTGEGTATCVDAVDARVREQEGIKRALDAVRAALEERGVKSPMPYYVRISTLPQLFSNPLIVERFVSDQPSDGGAPEVKSSLLKAAAVCRFSLLPKSFGFDVEDAIKKADEMAVEEEAVCCEAS